MDGLGFYALQNSLLSSATAPELLWEGPMNSKGKIETFRSELALIRSPFIQQLVSLCLAKTPDYFFTVGASATSKHHPAYTLGSGGLVRHTKAAVKIYSELTQNGLPYWYQWQDHDIQTLMEQTEIDDVCIAALILHDTYKRGDGEGGEHSLHEHPILAAQQIIKTGFSIPGLSLDEGEIVHLIAGLVETHMGKWAFSHHSSTILPVPETWLARVVHLCDYLASRKCIEVQLEVSE